MNTEEDEFKRIEAEAKRRAQAAEDDDTQVYTSNVALDNEQAAKIEQLEKKLAERSAEYLAAHITYDKGYQAGRQDAEDAFKRAIEAKLKAVMVEEQQRMAKRIEGLEALLERQTARIVDLQTHIENFDGEDR